MEKQIKEKNKVVKERKKKANIKNAENDIGSILLGPHHWAPKWNLPRHNDQNIPLFLNEIDSVDMSSSDIPEQFLNPKIAFNAPTNLSKSELKKKKYQKSVVRMYGTTETGTKTVTFVHNYNNVVYLRAPKHIAPDIIRDAFQITDGNTYYPLTKVECPDDIKNLPDDANKRTKIEELDEKRRRIHTRETIERDIKLHESTVTKQYCEQVQHALECAMQSNTYYENRQANIITAQF